MATPPSCRARDTPRLRSAARSIASLLAEPSSHHGDAEAGVAGDCFRTKAATRLLAAMRA
ncbi:MAG TPA: hypothetical protein VGI50_09565 [Solirubrobacteraceae bacterium]